MGKRPKKRDYGDKTRIDMNQPYPVAYWKQRFGVSDQELEDAVQLILPDTVRRKPTLLRKAGQKVSILTKLVR